MTAAVLTALADEARRLAGLGLMACTGGNLSARLPGEPLQVAVSVSGVDKGTLRPADFLVVDGDGRPVPPEARKPSDETLLHIALYRATGCGAVCHGHPAHAVALSLGGGDRLAFRGIEMQKAFAGTTTHDCERALPVVENSQDMHELSQRVLASRDPHVPAVLVRGHGVYAWGRNAAEAGRHLETVEWLAHVLWLCRGAGIAR